MTVLSYHSDEAVKETYLARVRAHREADEIVQGNYWSGCKGCAVGCTIHGSSHAAYETELGIPQVIARLEDCIFEGLPLESARRWPERFLAAIQPGRDLAGVWPRFALWLLRDSELLAIDESNRSAIEQVIAVYKQWIATGSPDESAARSAARSAEWSAESAESAEWSAARSAESAARSAEWSESAARSAARSAESAARSAAWNFAWEKMANKLVKLLEAA